MDYFMYTPVYKIWIAVIELLAPRTSFLVGPFAFRHIICNQDYLKHVYENGTIQLELIYSHPDRLFFCRLVNKATSTTINWKGTPPELIIASDLESLKVQIDTWMNFIRAEI